MQPPKGIAVDRLKGPFRPFENKSKIEKGPYNRPPENQGRLKCKPSKMVE